MGSTCTKQRSLETYPTATKSAPPAKAAPLFHDGLKRIEIWCGSRKVGEISAKSGEISGGEGVRDSA
jgi:hypothetical protein